ncbi:hypothetical protein DRE_04672 [Drechslerella stenobrocha 248]|uniref:Uncharacterized protein n=1 Tax=Drechslerella stenobrocha 248 TaxID=1043628 RepID=W7I1K3_9PEZI|nr:hypothetical protein DRE_04672 [Drechslerella stenobrocha 248]
MWFPTFQKGPRKGTVGLLSLPNEILIEIFTYVALERLQLRGHQYTNGNPVVIRRPGDTDPDATFKNPSQLAALMRTSQRLHDVTYPLFYERLSVGHMWGRGRPAIERAPVAAIPRLLEIIEKDPRRAQAVQVLHIRESWEEDIWQTTIWKSKNIKKRSELQRMIQLLQRISRNMGLTDNRFMNAIEEGREDMIVALLLFSLPRLKEAQLKLNLCGWKFGKAYLRRTKWIEEALAVATPRCAATLQRFDYGKYATRPCMWSWCPAVWQLMKFPRLRSFEARNLSVEKAPRRTHLKDALENYRGMGTSLAIAMSNNAESCCNTIAAVTNGTYSAKGVCDRQLQPTEQDTKGESEIPSKKSLNIAHMEIRGFNTHGIHLDKIIAAPRELDSLRLIRGDYHIDDQVAIGNAILSQAASLRTFYIDFGSLYSRLLISGLINLTRLEVDNRIFVQGGVDVGYYASEPATDPNLWLPRSLVTLSTFCSGGRGSYSCSAVGDALCMLSPASLPHLASVSMEIYLNDMTASQFTRMERVLLEKGIHFKYGYLDDSSSEDAGSPRMASNTPRALVPMVTRFLRRASLGKVEMRTSHASEISC